MNVLEMVLVVQAKAWHSIGYQRILDPDLRQKDKVRPERVQDDEIGHDRRSSSVKCQGLPLKSKG